MYSRCCLLSLLGRCSTNTPCSSFLLFCGACFRLLLFSAMDKFKLKCKGIFNRGCLGCCTKPSPIISMDDLAKGLRSPAQTMMKDEESEQFWHSSSLGLMDHTHIHTPHFVNHGLVLWNQTRQEWIGNRECESETQVGEARISYNATYESLLGTNKPFPQPIPLREMVDFLVDIWEQDGLYEL